MGTNINHITIFIGQFWNLMTPWKPLFYKAMLWIFAMQLLGIFEPYMMMYIIDGITSGRPIVQNHLFPLCAGMLFILVSIGLIQIRKNLRIRDVWMTIEHDLPVACGKKLLQLPLVYHQSENTGAIVGKVVRGVGKTTEVVGILLYEIFPLIIMTIITGAMLIWVYWKSALVLGPIIIVFSVITAYVKIKLADRRMHRHELDGEADEALGQAITNVMTTQAFAQEEREMQMVKAIRKQVNELGKSEFATYDSTDFIRNGIVSLGRIGIIFVCARAALGDVITMGMLVLISTLAEKVFTSCYRIGPVFDHMLEAAEPVMRMTKIFAEQDIITNPEKHLPVTSRFVGHISFEKVTYSYKKWRSAGGAKNKAALCDVNLDIKPGETIGVVGESGGGKSTLVKLLMRFDDPDSGQVKIDGNDLRQMRMTDFRQMIGYVPQEVEIYDTTVAKNIAYGRPNATKTEIEYAARVANSHEFISNLENGYDEIVGNRGLRLSGGQRQRIGIARAVLLDPPILIFDEATSHVDVVSEKKIQRSIEELRRGRTLLIIAHRLSTIKNADRIIVMDNGRIKEIGTHSELLRRNGIYNRLVDLQTRVEATM